MMRRRTFLLAGLGAGGALFVGWAVTPPRPRLVGRTAPDIENGAVALNGWLTIAPDDTVTVVVPKAEMGQGIHTALAMLVAEELGCDWDRVRIAHSPVDAIYGNVAVIVESLPLRPEEQGPLARWLRWTTAKTARQVGLMITGGSSSIRDCWGPMRDAGASARTALVAAAAARTGVSADSCRVERGIVVCGSTRLRFGELVAEAATQKPRRVALKPMAEFTRLGIATPRLQGVRATDGTLTYSADVRLPGMLYAAVAHAPTLGGVPATFNRGAALARAGVSAVVPLAGSGYGDVAGVAVVADSWWRAQQALAALAITWTPGPHAALSSDTLTQQLRTAAQADDGFTLRGHGKAQDALDTAARTLEATYQAPYLAHATMEPMNATVRVDSGRAELWTSTQVPGVARDAVARVVGIEAEQVTVHQYVMGGGFGRRLDVDYIAQAAAIAKAVPGVPVQTLWSREEDMRHDFYRPATVSHLRAALDANGVLTGLSANSAGQQVFTEYGPRIGLGILRRVPDRTSTEGIWDQPYAIAALRASHTATALPVPVGSWRAVGHSQQAFFLESFLDEIAHATNQDPAAFRRAMLRDAPRARAVLDLVLTQSQWTTAVAPAADGQACARGMALHASFGSIVAQVAEVSLSSAGEIRVHRVVVAIDCGFPVNPNAITQQMESGVIDGLSTALYGEITIANGAIQQGNFDGYRLLRMHEAPRIETFIVPSMDEPGGVGETGLPPIAPAVANAVFALTGTRLRTMPLRLPSPVATT